ncbi:MAG: preprotein translocase subunit YajC [Bacteroidales bacterium]
MNFNVILQQTAEAGTGNWSFLIMMGLIFVVMYFFMIRPQQKKQKELAKFRSSLEKGDKVVTLGGIYGVVAEVRDQYVLVEVDSNVKLRIDKSAIVKDITDIPAGK